MITKQEPLFRGCTETRAQFWYESTLIHIKKTKTNKPTKANPTTKPNQNKPTTKNNQQTQTRKWTNHKYSNGCWIPCLRFKPRKVWTIAWPTSPTLSVGQMAQSARSRKSQQLFWPQLSIYQYKQWQITTNSYGKSQNKLLAFSQLPVIASKNIFICSCLKGWRRNRCIYSSLHPFSNQIKEFLLGSTQLTYKVWQHNITALKRLC